MKHYWLVVLIPAAEIAWAHAENTGQAYRWSGPPAGQTELIDHIRAPQTGREEIDQQTQPPRRRPAPWNRPAVDVEARAALCRLYQLYSLPPPAFCTPQTAPWTPGMPPSDIYLRFNAGRDNISVPNNPSLIVDGALTIEGFINIQGPGGIGPRVLEIIDTYSLHFYQGKLWFCLYSSGWTCVSTSPPAEKTWTHLAGTWDGTTMKLFVDGQIAGTAPFSGPLNHDGPGDQSLKVGNGWTLIDGFNGYIDEVRISDTARYNTDFIVQRQYVPDDHTIVLWHLDMSDLNTSTAHDSSSNHNDGTLAGPTWVSN